MSNRALVSRRLTVRCVDDAELALLLEWVNRPGSGERWVASSTPSGVTMIWPPDGTIEPIDDFAGFVRGRGQIGFIFDDFSTFRDRFIDASDIALLMRVAGIIAPVIPDLHPTVRGVDYELHPSDKTQRLINLLGRFLPKSKAIALQTEVDGQPVGLYVRFNKHRHIIEVVGTRHWPQEVIDGASLKKLAVLGAPVEVGIRITTDAFASLFTQHLNRAGYAHLFKIGDIVLDPLPLAPKLALKAARIL